MSDYDDLIENSRTVKLMSSGDNDLDTIDTSATELLILIVDVSQGECTILIERHRVGSTPLWCCIIDGGYGLPGRGAIVRYLKAFGVRRVDAIICTHFDGDHTRGLTEYLSHHAVADLDTGGSYPTGQAQVVRLIVRNGSSDESKSSTKLKLLAAAERAGVTIIEATEGALEVGKPTRTKVRCIHTDRSALQDENDGSIALHIQFGSFSYYTAGDLPSHKELALLAELERVDAFKCGHHGSANSTPPELLSTWKPLAAFISAGRNSFGHPTYDVIERLGVSDGSIQKFYLTNCIHNRRLVNPNYLDSENLVLEDYFKLPGMEIEEEIEAERFRGELTVYDRDAIVARSSQIDEGLEVVMGERDAHAWKQCRRVYRALERAAEHETKTGLKSGIVGHVAGSETDLGTIAVYIPSVRESDSPVFHVGFIEDIEHTDESEESDDFESRLLDAGRTFVWYRHERGREVERVDAAEDYLYEDDLDQIEDAMSSVIGPPSVDLAAVTSEFQQVYEEMSRAENPFAFIQQKIKENIKNQQEAPSRSEVSLSEIVSSPGVFRPSVELRYDDYRKFCVPTVVGLSQSKQESILLPFCCLCYSDPDVESPDFEFMMVSEVTGDYQMHRLCFYELFERLEVEMLDQDNWVEITRNDAYDLHRIEVGNLDDIYDFGFSDSWASWFRSKFRAQAGNTPLTDGDSIRRVIAGMRLPKKRRR